MRLQKVRWCNRSLGVIYRDNKPSDSFHFNELYLWCKNLSNPRDVRTIMELCWLSGFAKNNINYYAPNNINYYAPGKRKIRRTHGKCKEYAKKGK